MKELQVAISCFDKHFLNVDYMNSIFEIWLLKSIWEKPQSNEYVNRIKEESLYSNVVIMGFY